MKTLLQLHDEEQREAEVLRRYDERERQLKREIALTLIELLAGITFLAIVLMEVLRR